MLLLRMLGLIMIMFLLCDADSTCPPGSTPLQVEPAVIIREYGDHVDVNCSHYDDHLDILWRVGNNTLEGDDDYDYFIHNFPLSDWNMNAECIVKINKSHECSKHLEINVYKNPEVVLSTKNVQASGDETLYELQCDILDVAPVQNLVLRWYTNNELNKTDVFNNTIRTPVNESSTLTLRVGREDNVVQVTCEAQLVFGPSGSLPSVFHTHNVSAHYAPELKIQSNTQDIYVAEGDDISLNCEAEGNPPPVFQWTSDGLSVLEEDSDTLNITQVNASSTYICTAANNLGNITKQIYVHVTNVNVQATTAAAPMSPLAPETGCPVTLTPPEIVVRFGDPVSVNCTTSGDKGLGWEATVGGTGLENVTVLPWTVENLNTWNPLASCYTFANDKQCEKSLNFTVYQTPDQVSVLDDGPMLEGKEYQLLCSITNVAPVQKLKVKWYRGHETLFEDTFNDTSLVVLTSQNLNSTLSITPTKENNGAVFTCQAELHLGPNGPKFLPNKTSAPYTAVVHYTPIIINCPAQYPVKHKYSLDTLLCKADGNPPPTVKWYHEDEVMNPSVPLSRNDSGNYRAEFKNSVGTNSTTVQITVEYEPSFTCSETYDVKVNGELQCEPEGLPTPTLTWFKDGQNIAPPQWTKEDSGEYLLQASNKHGSANHTLRVNILYAPELKIQSNTQDIDVAEGDDISLNCEAEGNPPPVFQWTSDGLSVLEEDSDTLSITQVNASSKYICTATNNLGKITKQIHVHVTNVNAQATPLAPETGHFSPWLWLPIIISVIILTISIFVVFLRLCQKKEGQYRFVQQSDISMSIMTNEGNENLI